MLITEIQEALLELKNAKTVCLSIESTSDTWYTFPCVVYEAFVHSLNRSLASECVFSTVNVDGAAIALPWPIIRSVHAADEDAHKSQAERMVEAEEDGVGTEDVDPYVWRLIFDRNVEEAEKSVHV